MDCYWQQWLGHICQHSVTHTIVVTFQTNRWNICSGLVLCFRKAGLIIYKTNSIKALNLPS